MRHILCTVEKNEDSDIIGFVPEIFRDWWEDTSNKSGGYMPSRSLGHDLLDHRVKGENGSLECEFQAVGCMAWNTDLFSNQVGFSMNTSEERLRSILNEVINDAWQLNNYNFPSVKNAPKVSKLEDLEEIIEFFDSAWGLFREKFLDNNGITDSGMSDDEVREHTEYFDSWCKENQDNIFSWFTYGFWYASVKRYKDYDSWDVFRFKEKIDETVQKVADRLSDEDLGEKFMVSYSLKYREVSIKRISG